jgi:hypothetical protein
MNTLKTLSVSLLLATALLSPVVVSAKKTHVVNFNETPVKTICLKHPAAADVNKFFSEITMLTFEVFKPGTKEDVANIISSLKNTAGIESVTEGNLTGDYQAITISLKSAKNKAWFTAQFKKAGLNTIRINNNPIVEVDKM